ncbi:hypothetical protein CYMTET_53639 [Cymbomonas tetramitiformis]|uniref:Uncharacterized protein n=1 Tax=Cymbomonas tetramitiformis TaxID=36881 RepID=A0AAE0BHP8_9CHLO|nr:hypothetical protein CYMTET_53639 [Cymbomonas tetramitiformis]
MLQIYSTLLDRHGLQLWITMPCVLGGPLAYLILALVHDPYLFIAGMALWGCSRNIPLFAKTYFATTLSPDLAIHYNSQSCTMGSIAAVTAPFCGVFLFTLGSKAPFVTALGVLLASVAFALPNVKLTARSLSGEPSSDTFESTRSQEKPTLETFSDETGADDVGENVISREKVESRESCLRKEKEQCTPKLNPLFEAENNNEEPGETIEEGRVSNNIAKSQPVARNSDEPHLGSFVIIGTYLATGLSTACSSIFTQFLQLYARDKFDLDTTTVSSFTTLGELFGMVTTVLFQEKPALMAPGMDLFPSSTRHAG